MGSLIDREFRKLVKRCKRKRQPPWEHSWARPFDAVGDAWDRVSIEVMRTLDELKKDGVQRPLKMLQEEAFQASLRSDEPTVHTLALWLTDTRIRKEALESGTYDAGWLRGILTDRGLIRPGG